jgi:hypothetical protein
MRVVPADAEDTASAASRPSLAVTLTTLRALRDEAVELASRESAVPRRDGSRRAAGEPLTTADVCIELVKPATAARQCAYVEVAAHTVPATVYVSHAWKYLFHQVVDALEQAADERDGVWFCALNNNQWATGAHSYAFFEREFRANLAAIGRTVLVFAPWSAPITLTRAWCLYEVFLSAERGSRSRS